VALEFARVVPQVQTMGRYLGHRDRALSGRLERALELFYNAPDLEVVHRRIALVRGTNISGYRGAAPLPPPDSEIINGVGPGPDAPARAVALAVDGSQIYPDVHAPALYYLINIGVFTYFFDAAPRLPDQTTHPQLVYTEQQLHDRDGRVITNQTVNARRTVQELARLADEAWRLREADAGPVVALHDGNLLKFFGANEVAESAAIQRDYLDALRKLRDAGAILIGYAERSRSAALISLLHLLSLPDEQVTDENLKTSGDLEGLPDIALFGAVLEPGQRSAVLVQNSPQNRDYRQIDPDLEIGFCYINVSDHGHPVIARVEMPLWVARYPERVALAHAVILAQCAIQGRRRFPYALTRADELAYVSGAEKGQLDELIRIEMLRNQAQPEESNKLQSKGLARGGRRAHRLRV
jgi:hypothetical protein